MVVCHKLNLSANSSLVRSMHQKDFMYFKDYSPLVTLHLTGIEIEMSSDSKLSKHSHNTLIYFILTFTQSQKH